MSAQLLESPPSPAPSKAFLPAWFRTLAAWRPVLGLETLAVLASLFFSLFCNRSFWNSYVELAGDGSARAWITALSLAVAITGLQAAALCLLLSYRTAKPLLAILLLATALAAFHMDHYGVYFDPDMLRNVLHTEPKEAGELVTPALLLTVGAMLLLPMLALWRLRIHRRSWQASLLRRSATAAVLVAVSAAAMLLSFQDLASLMRNNHDLRYLITPGNLVASTLQAAADDADAGKGHRQPLGTDAHVATVAGRRPRLLLVVVGETVRAQNWGLNGYARQTTPELARMDVLNFTDVSACGSSTEVSLPCMFSPIGRHNYDAAAIRHSESLLHVLDHAGVRTLWRDNQTGCKGVCDGLPFVSYLHADAGRFCNGERCLDEVLLRDLEKETDADPVDRVVVLHPLGNHGPAYFSRYPAEYRHFVPTCDTSELGDCSREQIVNSYDNAILYTDHFLAQAIRFLQARSDYDSALVYVSDHGESLGENHLYLHGVPYAIAPDVQLKVPMIAWLSPGLEQAEGFDNACLQGLGRQPASHDNLFSSVLGLMQVRTTVYNPAEDLFAPCVQGALAAVPKGDHGPG